MTAKYKWVRPIIITHPVIAHNDVVQVLNRTHSKIIEDGNYIEYAKVSLIMTSNNFQEEPSLQTKPA